MTPGKQKLGCTVVLTVKDDAEALDRTLQSLAVQTHRPEELILAIADSQDATRSVAESFSQKHAFVKVLAVGPASRSLGRNLAVRESTQNIIVFTDAGCLPDKNWLFELLKPFQDPDVSLVSGLTVIANTSSFAEAQGAFVLIPRKNIGKHPLPATRNMAIRKQLFLQHQGFHSELNFAEDFEFARRLQASGVNSTFVPDARVAWEARSSIGAYFNMIVKLTQGDIQAGTWRRGHITMWLRYLVFLSFGTAMFAVTSSLSIATLSTAALYLIYLLFKLARFHFTRSASYFWAILLQVHTDFAVLLGSAQGVWNHQRNKFV